MIDYLSCILFKTLGFFIRLLPLRLAYFLGALFGRIFYYLDRKKRTLVYANIKTAFSKEKNCKQIQRCVCEFYVSFGINIMEFFLIPKINKEFIKRYITLEGRENIDEAFKVGKGVIFLAVHAGSWEFSNIVSANLGFILNVIVRNQRFPRLSKLLNSYRRMKGCRLIERKSQTRDIILALRRNEGIGMTIDQGGREGERVNFLGKSASMATGAFRLALKNGTVILPSYYHRVNGPYQKIIVDKPYVVEKTQDKDFDIKLNVQKLCNIFESKIRKYPQEYFWRYKIWKYNNERNILILSDTKAGHVRQSEAVAKITLDLLQEKGLLANVDKVDISFKTPAGRHLLNFTTLFSGKFCAQGCLWCLRKFLTPDTYRQLSVLKPDIVISTGASLAGINYLISKENLAKSICVMKPSLLSFRRFDLLIVPKHDNTKKYRNTCFIQGALNLINEDYLQDQSKKLMNEANIKDIKLNSCIGFFVGGNSKEFILDNKNVELVIKQIKQFSVLNKYDILASTSRRTSFDMEKLMKDELGSDSSSRLLVIANEKNYSSASAGIMALSKIIILSPESISMISEAVSSKRYCIVFKSEGLSNKHKRFLEDLSKNKQIYLVSAKEIFSTIDFIIKNRPKQEFINDNELVKERIKELL